MSQFGKGNRGASRALIAASAATALVGGQMIFSVLPGGPSIAFAVTTDVIDEHAPQPAQDQRASSIRPVARMNAAVVTGQFEELVKPTPVPTIAPTPIPTPVLIPTPKPTLYESGIASTYGENDGFEGNLTACGQVFRTNVVQVAHKSLPCGTILRIEDRDTGRSVIARVTDRGPYIPGRIVDLSWGAFSQLDPAGPGLLNVNVYVLDQ